MILKNTNSMIRDRESDMGGTSLLFPQQGFGLNGVDGWMDNVSGAFSDFAGSITSNWSWDTVLGNSPSTSGGGMLPAISTNVAQTASPSFDWSRLPEMVAGIYMTKTQIDFQKDMAKINLNRAAQGLSPVSVDTSGLTPKVRIEAGPDDNTKKMIMLAALALAGYFIFTQIQKSRK